MTQPGRPAVSIVIPTLDRADLLADCLDSIRRTVHAPHEIICVTVETDEATQRLLDREIATRNIVQPRSLGYVRAANAGLQQATGDFVTILNDDCVLLPHSIDNALRFINVPSHRARVGQVAFFHDSPITRNIHAQIDVEGVRYVVGHVRGLCYANFGLARRSLYEKLGWLDERFGMYGADPDFSLCIWYEAGLEILPCPGALIHHGTHDDDRAVSARARQRDDNNRLFEKWGIEFSA